MGLVTLLNQFLAGTPALGSEVKANDDAIVAEINGNIETINLQPALKTDVDALRSGTITTLHKHNLSDGAADVTATVNEINQSLQGIGAGVTAGNLTLLTDGTSIITLHKHNLVTGAVDVVATASEINQALQGVSATVTSTNLNSLTDSTSVITLHKHNLITGAVDVLATAAEITQALQGITSTVTAAALNKITDSNQVFSPGLFQFTGIDISANLTSVLSPILGVSNIFVHVPAMAGSIIGISARSSAAVTAGSLILKPTINGTEQNVPTITLDINNPRNAFSVVNKDVTAFVAGDLVGLNATTDATWSPTTNDIIADLWIEV